MSDLNMGADVLPQDQAQAPNSAPDATNGLPAGDELLLLRQENAALRTKVEELEQLLAAASQVAEDRWVELQREYETLIEEKSETIRTLHHKNAELRQRAASAPDASANTTAAEEPPDRQELIRLQREVQEQRRQMEQDEESMMAQMRQMEMALAKDRAELARQRAELQRLHDDLKHEQDVASRDGGLRQRLGALQRGATNAAAPRTAVNQDTPAPNPQPKSPAGTENNPPKSGLFRRIFGSNP